MDILGYLAAALTTFSFLPQVIKVYKTKSTKDISLYMFLIFTTGIFFWLLYGIFTLNFPIIAANSITFVLSSFILSYKIRYK